MESVGQICYNVLVDEEEPTIVSTVPSSIFYNGNIVTYYGAKQFNKLGICAPTGTQAIINGIYTVIGKSGMYEADYDGIAITSLSFRRPIGSSGIRRAVTLQVQHQGEIDQEGRIRVAERDKAAYNESDTVTEDDLKQYNYSVNGIYTIEPEALSGELYNVLIDFIYE